MFLMYTTRDKTEGTLDSSGLTTGQKNMYKIEKKQRYNFNWKPEQSSQKYQKETGEFFFQSIKSPQQRKGKRES